MAQVLSIQHWTLSLCQGFCSAPHPSYLPLMLGATLTDQPYSRQGVIELPLHPSLPCLSETVRKMSKKTKRRAGGAEPSEPPSLGAFRRVSCGLQQLTLRTAPAGSAPDGRRGGPARVPAAAAQATAAAAPAAHPSPLSAGPPAARPATLRCLPTSPAASLNPSALFMTGPTCSRPPPAWRARARQAPPCCRATSSRT